MARLLKNRTKKAGLPPGSLVHIGERVTESPGIRVIVYGEQEFRDFSVQTPEECFPVSNEGRVTWINIDGVDRVETVERIGQVFNLHPLLLEDIVNTDQRPKAEAYDEYLFIVLKALSFDEKERVIVTDQLSFVLGHNYVISFQERRSVLFDGLIDRLKNSGWRLRKMGTDYLVYSLIDVIIDNYFVILEVFGEKIDDLEERLITAPGSATLKTIQQLKREMIMLRRSVWPLREVISSIEHGESPLVHGSTRLYLRDLYDHTVESIDTIELYRDMLSGMLDIYLSSVSARLNEVMKVLTIIATIFMPLTFIAGLYGMNFEYMPELKSRWGYPSVLLLMVLVTVSMVLYFRRKKWF